MFLFVLKLISYNDIFLIYYTIDTLPEVERVQKYSTQVKVPLHY